MRLTLRSSTNDAIFAPAISRPFLKATSGESCLYNVPTLDRSSSSNKGMFLAPGIWPAAYSEGDLTSRINQALNWLSTSRIADTSFMPGKDTRDGKEKRKLTS